MARVAFPSSTGGKPRVVRNFWLTAKIDGRDTELRGGPVDRTGGFDLRILARDYGDIRTAVEVRGVAFDNGATLRITVILRDRDGNEQREHLDFVR